MAETSQVSGAGPDTLPQRSANILLVDDNAGNLQALRSILDPLGQNLVESHSGEDAIGKIRSFDFALVLLDVNLPGTDGFETAKRIRSEERSRHTPIIFLTAHDMDRGQIERGYALGAVDFLLMPLTPSILKAKAASLIDLYQEKAQATRQANELRLLIDATNDYAIFMLDPDGRVMTWNSGAERLKGYTADEIIGQHFSRFYPKEVIESGWPAHELKVARADGRFEDEGWRIRKDGSTFWANVVITGLRDEAGHFRGFSKITRDLTERKRSEDNARRFAEEAAARRVAEQSAGVIQQQRERLHVTLESIGDAVISTDVEGHVTFLNPVAETLTGWKSEDAVGRPLDDVFHIINEHTRQPVENPALRALKDGIVVGLANHTMLIAKDGTERPIADSAAPIRDAKNNVFGSVLVFRDVTQQSRAEQHRNARLAATQILNTSSSVDDASESVLKTMCESFGWDVGFYWSLNEERDALVCRQSWGRPDVAVDEFKQTSCNRQFTKAEGLPGRIWATGKPAWILDIAQDDNFPRLASALRYDLHSAIGCPIVLANETLGVIEFFTKRIRAADADLLETMTTIAGNFGQFIERNIAQERLRQSEKELAEFFENASVGLHWVGPDGTILRANRAELELLGYPPDEYIGHNIAEFHVDEDVICDILRRLTAKEELHGYEARMRCKDGTVKHVSINSNVLWTDDEFIHTRCFTRDITERKEAEAALRDSDAQFRQLADSMPQIVWTADPGGNIDYLNRRWTEFTGFPDTVGNEGWASILHPEDAGPAADRWAACLNNGNAFEMEVRLLDRRRHNYRWHLIRTVAVHDECGKVVRWFGTSTDIQEQKRAEESARYLAEASAALAGVVDFESTLQKVAKLAVPYFADWSAVDVADNGGLRRLAVAHRDPAKIELAHELERQYPSDLQAESGIGGVLRTKKPEMVSEITDEMLVQGAKDERHLQLIRSLGLKSYICVPLILSDKAFGALTFATAESGRTYSDEDLALAVDLANRSAVAVENTQLYEALRESDRRKDEFLATLAHELRNPLAPIRNSLQILKLRRADEDTVERSLDMMERQLHHLVRLVDDLLDVSRVVRGKIDLRKEKVELATIIARAVETIQPLIDANNHHLTVHSPSDSVLLNADPVRLSQVVANLLANAAKYTEPGGNILIDAERDGESAVLRVRDDGIGIDKNLLAHIFDLFVQADHTSTRSQGGLGIGLTLVKNLVELHHGTVQARSEGLGKGSEFVVRLPIARGANNEGDGRERLAPAHGPTPGTGFRLLVVDDNHDAANSLAMLLTLKGHEVAAAYSGSAALELVKNYEPDLVFLDIGMPGMDGCEVARRLREDVRERRLILVALTGWGQEEDRKRTTEAGFDYHLVKPPDATALEAVLANLRTSIVP